MIAPLLALAIGGVFALSYVQAKKAQRQAKKLAEQMAGVLINKESNIEAIPVVYGTRRIGGTRVYMSTSQDESHKWLYCAIVLCEGEVESITNIEIDDKPYTDDNGDVIPDSDFVKEFTLVYHEVFTGTDDQAEPNETNPAGGIQIIKEGMWTQGQPNDLVSFYGMKLPPEVGGTYDLNYAHEIDEQDDAANFRLSGLAAICLRFEWNDDKNPFSGGAPKVTALVKGKKVYDPRKDESRYGSGSHRENNPATWEYSDNAAVCLRDYLTSERHGKDLTENEIDDLAFITAANDLDSFLGQNDEPLFACNAVVDTDDKLFANIEKFLLNCRGFLPYTNGRYTLRIDQKVESQADVLTINEENIIGGIKVSGVAKEDKFNQIVVKFPDAALNYQPNNAVWPDPKSDNPTKVANPAGGFYTEAELSAIWVEQDGEVLVDEIDLDYVTDYYQARDLARLFARRSRVGMTCALTIDSIGIDLTCGDVVFINHQTPLWDVANATFAESMGYFQVDEIGLKGDGTVDLKLIEFRNSLYDYDPAEPQVISNPTAPGYPYQVAANAKRTVAEAQMQASLGWTFNYTDHSFGAYNLTTNVQPAYITLTPVATDPYWRTPTFSLSGALAPIIRVKVRRVSGTGWDGSIAYKTSSHGFSYSNYRQQVSDPTRINEWVIVEWDMTQLTAGGKDWVDSTIEQLGIHLGQTVGDVFDVAWVSVGHLGSAVTQINNENIQFYIKDLAVQTLQIADNAVTVPLVDNFTTTKTGDGATYHNTAEVDITLPLDDCPISIWWSVEHGYSGGGAGWRFKLLRDGVVIDSRTTTMTALNDFPGAVYFDNSTGRTAGQTYTYTFQWWGENANITAGSVRMFVMAVAK